MNILYYGVFDGQKWRSEYPMAEGLEKLQHTLFRCNFRSWWGMKIAPAWHRHHHETDLVFLQNGIPFPDKYLQLIRERPLIFLASEFALCSAQHILDSQRPPDLVLAHSEQTFEYCQKKGIRSQRVHLAYNPAQYRLLQIPYRYDICFIGGMTPRRKQMIERLSQEGYRLYAGSCHNADKINEIYNASRVVLHIHAGTENYVPIRLFEVMPTQGCLLIESMGRNTDVSLGDDFYTSFCNEDELLSQVEYLLRHEEKRRVLVKNAQAKASHHTWQARMQEYSHYFESCR